MQYLAHAEIVARWSVYLLFLLVPFFFVPLPWVSVAQSKLLLAVVVITVGFLAWIVSSFNASQLRFPKSPLLLASALIPAAYLISALATGASWESFAGDGRGQDTVIGFVLLYIASLMSAAILRSSNLLLFAFRLLLTGALAVITVQIVHLAIPSFTFGGVLTTPATSIVGSWHDLGIFLVLVVFIFLTLSRTTLLEGYWNLAAITAAFLGLLLLIVINFSDVWLGLFGLSVFYLLFLYRTHSGSITSFDVRHAAPWLACAIVSLGMYFGGNAVQAILPVPLQVVQIEVRPSWAGTFAVGREVFAEPSRIFFGSGPNTFLRQWDVYKPLSVNKTEFWNTDFYYGVGFIPTSFVTTGILGLLAWGAVCGALLWGLYRTLRDPASGAIRAILMGSAVFLTGFHILYVPGPTLSLLTFLVFGVLVAEEFSRGMIREWVVSPSWESWKGRICSAALIVSGLMVFAGSTQTVRALISDAFVSRAVVEYNLTQDAAKASHSIVWAVGILPGNDRAHRAGVELGLLQLSKLLSASDESETTRALLQATLASAIAHGLAAVSIESGNYQNWLALARLYGELAGAGVEGAEERARDAYVAARESSPTTPLPYLGEAQLDLIKGDDVAARKNLEAALAVKLNFAPAHFLLSQIHARAGSLEKAREYGGAVVEIAPQDPLGWYNLGTILYAQKDYQDAALSFERAAALQNDYANALFLLGLSYYQLERKDDALKVLRIVLALNPEDAALVDLVEKMEEGRDLGPSFR